MVSDAIDTVDWWAWRKFDYRRDEKGKKVERTGEHCFLTLHGRDGEVTLPISSDDLERLWRAR